MKNKFLILLLLLIIFNYTTISNTSVKEGFDIGNLNPFKLVDKVLGKMIDLGLKPIPKKYGGSFLRSRTKKSGFIRKIGALILAGIELFILYIVILWLLCIGIPLFLIILVIFAIWKFFKLMIPLIFGVSPQLKMAKEGPMVLAQAIQTSATAGKEALKMKTTLDAVDTPTRAADTPSHYMEIYRQ